MGKNEIQTNQIKELGKTEGQTGENSIQNNRPNTTNNPGETYNVLRQEVQRDHVRHREHRGNAFPNRRMARSD